MEVQYRAGKDDVDDERIVFVDVDDQSAPRFALVVSARIRSPLTLSQKAVELSGFPASTPETVVVISNFSDHEWSGFRAEADADWLTPSVVQMQTNASEMRRKDQLAPVQAWRLLLQARSGELAAGTHTARVRVIPAEFREAAQSVLVVLRIRKEAEVYPSEVHFGQIQAGKSCERRLILRFDAEMIPSDPSNVTVMCDTNCGIRLAWIRTEGPVWELSATADATAIPASIAGNIHFAFSDSRSQDITIPVDGSCEQRK